MDFRFVWAQLCFAAAARVLWDCWVWKRADFGKTRAETQAGFARLCFQHANHQLWSLGAKGFSPLQKLRELRVFLLSLGDLHCPLERENSGQNKVGLFEGVSLFGKEESVFLWSSTTQENNHPINTFFFLLFFASWMHILSCELLFKDMLTFPSLIYSSSFLSSPCRRLKWHYFFLNTLLEPFSLFFFNVLLVRGGKKTQKYPIFSFIPVHRFILRAGRHKKRKFVYYIAANFFKFLGLFPVPPEHFCSVFLTQFPLAAPLGWQVMLLNDPCSSK